MLGKRTFGSVQKFPSSSVCFRSSFPTSQDTPAPRVLGRLGPSPTPAAGGTSGCIGISREGYSLLRSHLHSRRVTHTLSPQAFIRSTDTC